MATRDAAVPAQSRAPVPSGRVKIYRAHSVSGMEWVRYHAFDDMERLVELGVEPVAEGWLAPSVSRLLEDEGIRFAPADLPWLGGHWLVARRPARDVLEPVLGATVEFLPLDCDDGTELWVTHALVRAPVLDVERSDLKRFRSGGIMRIVRHEFLPVVAGVGPAFHLEAMRRGALYVTDAVVDAIETAGLTGVRFEEVWSSAE